MKINGKQREDFLFKRQKLQDASKILKSEFVGIDNVIDEVLGLVEVWYIFPEAQIKPTVINLWGMTGIGKTSLIKRLFEILELDSDFVKFDMGSDGNLSFAFSHNLSKKSGKNMIIAFDEFQLARTIDQDGKEINRKELRSLWELVDSGIIQILTNFESAFTLYGLIEDLEVCINSGVRVENGIVVSGESVWEDRLRIFKKSLYGLDKVSYEKMGGHLFIPTVYYHVIKKISKENNLDSVLNKELKKLNERESVKFLKSIVDKAYRPESFDFSKSLIFIIGNLDEVYRMAKDVDPDSDVDMFYENSLKITLPEVKVALQKRFRAEQIARLGNNHVIYPAFSSKAFKDLINLEVGKFIENIKNKFEIDIKLDESVYDIIYKEGVFPSQGTRPIFTTINSMIKGYIGKIIASILEEGKNVDNIKWSLLKNDKYKIDFFDKEKFQFSKEFEVKFKIENLRKSTEDEEQAHTALHEAGHVVLSSLCLQIIPNLAVSKTAGDAQGFCRIEGPQMRTKEYLFNYITMLLGGYVAEILFLGENSLSSGSVSDIEKATVTASSMVKKYGMFGKPLIISHPHFQANMFFLSDKYEDIVLEIIENCKKQAEEVLKKEKKLLFKITEFLSKNSKIEKEQIIEFVEKYAINKPDKFKDKDNYYSYKEIIMAQIESLKG